MVHDSLGVVEMKSSPEASSSRFSIDAGEASGSVSLPPETEAFLSPPEKGDKASQVDTEKAENRSRIFRCVLQEATLLLSLGLLFAGYDLYCTITASPEPLSVERGLRSRPCGEDPLASRSKGCFFDPIAMAWLPSACHDFELTKKFLEMNHWRFSTDPSGSQVISLANIHQGRHSILYVSKDYLRHRCVFAWKKIHRALINKTAIEGYMTDWEGLLECEKLFQEDEIWKNKALYEVTVGYPTCSEQHV